MNRNHVSTIGVRGRNLVVLCTRSLQHCTTLCVTPVSLRFRDLSNPFSSYPWDCQAPPSRIHSPLAGRKSSNQNSSHHSTHQNSSRRSIRHHSNHRSRKCLSEYMSVQIPEFLNLSPISSFSRPERPVFDVLPLCEPLAPLVPSDLALDFPLLSLLFPFCPLTLWTMT